MDKLHLAICDDDAAVLDIVSGAICSAFLKNDVLAEAETFKRCRDLERRMEECSFDLLFLDIDMPGEMDGIRFAKKLRAANSQTEIVFVSNREDKVFDALRTGPGGFIRKSRFLEDVPEVISLYLKNHHQRVQARLMVQNRSATTSIPLNTVLYIECVGKIQQLHLVNKQEPVVIRRSMQELERALVPAGFIRLHSGYLANFKFIRRLERGEAVLTNGERIPLSRRRIQEIRDQYMEWMQNEETVIL